MMACTATQAQTWQDTLARIETYFSKYKPENPGAQMAISRNGQIIFSKAWGMADLEHHTPMTTTSLTEAGSVSKQFTAAALLLLEQQGKLSINDDIHKYIPELPDYGTPITLRQVMQHTSGFRDWGSVAELTGWPRGTRTYSNNDALRIICRQKALNNVPGAEYIYSNTNYTLMTIIVQRVSGIELKDFTRPNIFNPADMPLSTWRSSYKKLVPNRAMAYSMGPDGRYLNDMPNESVYGHGGLLTTAEELVKWTNFYSSGKFGHPSLLPKQTAKSNFNNGVPHAYASGLVVTKLNGKDVIMHSGATASYRANLEYYPESGLCFAFVSNTSQFDGDSTSSWALTRNLFIPEPAKASPSKTPTVKVSEAELQKYSGWYRNPRTNAGMKLLVKDGKLYANTNTLLEPQGKSFFKAGGNRIEFMDGAFRMTSPDRDTLVYTAVEFSNVSEGAIAKYAGEYYSEEAEAQVSLVAEGTTLTFVQLQKPDMKFRLEPQYKDGFASPYGPVYFVRDARNMISGFRISLSRARNISFSKVK